jgi:Cyclin, C-terminal domain/Cyclin, N-terminal domain
MDQILNTFEIKGIKPDKFPLVSVACLIVAAKYYELDRHIPFIEDYSRQCKARLSVTSLKEYERHVLKWLCWDLSATPPSIYVQLMSLQGLCREDEKVESEVLKQSHLNKMAKFSELFAELIVGDTIFVQKKMSIIAAGCIMAARKAVKIEPIWNKELEKLSKYKQSDIEEVSRIIFNNYYAMVSVGKESIEWPVCKETSHKDKENIVEPNKANACSASAIVAAGEKEVFNLEEHRRNLENMKSSIESKLSVLDHQSKSLEMLIN